MGDGLWPELQTELCQASCLLAYYSLEKIWKGFKERGCGDAGETFQVASGRLVLLVGPEKTRRWV